MSIPRFPVQWLNGAAVGIGQNPFMCGKHPVADVDDVVSDFLSPVGRTSEDSWYALVVEDCVPVPVASDQQLDVAFFDGVHQLEIVEHRSVLGVVVDKDHRLFARNGMGYRIEPGEGLMRDECRGHPHVGAAAASQELDASGVEFEMLVAEDLCKGVASAFRPFGVVVAGYDPVWPLQFIENPFGENEFLVRPEVCQVASEDGELNIRLRVYVRYAAFKVLYP